MLLPVGRDIAVHKNVDFRAKRGLEMVTWVSAQHGQYISVFHFGCSRTVLLLNSGTKKVSRSPSFVWLKICPRYSEAKQDLSRRQGSLEL